ncbi:MAG TPA: YIP1 family protein [Acidobacteriota bacterium]|jgi:hypothetical protein
MSEELDPQAGEPGGEPEGYDYRTGMAGDVAGGEPAEAPRGFAAIVGPFLNAIVAPAQCWEALDARPALSAWIVGWIAVLSTVLAVINLPITQQVMVAATRAQMQAQGSEMSAEQLERMQQSMMTFGTVAAYASSIFLLVLVALTALVIWVLAAIMGGSGATFGRSFGVAAAAGVVRPFLYSLYVTIILQMNPPEIRRPEDIAAMTPTLGLDLLLSGPDTPVWLNAIFQRLDLFNLWWAVLIVGGSMALLKLSKTQGIVIALLIWLFGTLIAMGGAVLQTLG